MELGPHLTRRDLAVWTGGVGGRKPGHSRRRPRMQVELEAMVWQIG